MDAAIDAMQRMGFPEKVVCRRVKKLLREYGGDEGWTFIEDAYYTVLVESLLNEQEEEANKEKRTIGQKKLEDTVGAIGSGHSDSGRLDNTSSLSPPSMIPSPPSLTVPPKTRKHYSGWVVCDDEEDDFIELTPA
ncbi:Inactive histone-lysine N-methyltransferase [Actinidia chinensis var. chinensis]|uniref:Inactive histone-lysine N-methyltransferase n=1 Tax=Actinidia chinensis var. chinensis TaxID=1590841 RepID=A0A2R6RWT2_ACTCC|nr:Inactive histone-lysine N-methyltransferase [Actinidia chinensis var. chinensis]